ncbi:hypothetical protein PV379_48150, partial [Streptomyces caniscabiei]|uniref:hypothetical protein n=1 Tax=Streptomyces caniscabiei TaxID=2746961 RepID=UPI0029B0AA1F
GRGVRGRGGVVPGAGLSGLISPGGNYRTPDLRNPIGDMRPGRPHTGRRSDRRPRVMRGLPRRLCATHGRLRAGRRLDQRLRTRHRRLSEGRGLDGERHGRYLVHRRLRGRRCPNGRMHAWYPLHRRLHARHRLPRRLLNRCPVDRRRSRERAVLGPPRAPRQLAP